MIHETKEGCELKFGINYWFPKNDTTLCKIIIAIPIGAFYSQYEYFDTGDIVKGWRFFGISFMFYKRNPKISWPKSTKMNLFDVTYWLKNGKQYTVKTFEQREDEGLV